MRKFDIVTALLVLAGRIQARRVEKLKAREVALKATIVAAQEALTATQNERVNAHVRQLTLGK